MNREEALNKLWPELNCKGRSTDGTANLINTLFNEFEQRIAELTAPKTCDGCKYQTIPEADCKTCSRYYKDEYEPKEQK